MKRLVKRIRGSDWVRKCGLPLGFAAVMAVTLVFLSGAWSGGGAPVTAQIFGAVTTTALQQAAAQRAAQQAALQQQLAAQQAAAQQAATPAVAQAAVQQVAAAATGNVDGTHHECDPDHEQCECDPEHEQCDG